MENIKYQIGKEERTEEANRKLKLDNSDEQKKKKTDREMNKNKRITNRK